LAGASPVQIRLDIGLAQFDSRRAAVDDHAYAAPVGFAPGGDAKEMPERVAHGDRLGELGWVVNAAVALRMGCDWLDFAINY
jgi:hypothetical protein